MGVILSADDIGVNGGVDVARGAGGIGEWLAIFANQRRVVGELEGGVFEFSDDELHDRIIARSVYGFATGEVGEPVRGLLELGTEVLNDLIVARSVH
jgi:hypothetical protein